MSMDIEDDERYMYDDGRFADDGEEGRDDDFDIPTYDELDLEGRYYTYGSRSEYNEWRYYKIQKIKEERRQEQRIRRLKKSDRPNEYNYVEIPSYDQLSDEDKAGYASRKDYEEWRIKIIRKRRYNKIAALAGGIIALVCLIAIIGFIIYVFSGVFL